MACCTAGLMGCKSVPHLSLLDCIGGILSRKPPGLCSDWEVFRSSLLFKAVLQSNGAVKHQMLRCCVTVVENKVALTHELEALGVFGALGHRRFGQTPLDLAALKDLETVGIQAVEEVLVGAVGLGIGKEIVVQPDLGVGTVVRIDPVDRGALDLAAVRRVAAAAVRIVLAEDLK